jgi:hypothetical protein
MMRIASALELSTLRVALPAALLIAAPLPLGGCQKAADSANEAAARKDAAASTAMPTRQTTIDPVQRKLDAAGADAQKRRDEADRVGQ